MAAYRMSDVFTPADFAGEPNVLVSGPSEKTLGEVPERLVRTVCGPDDAVLLVTTETPAIVARQQVRRELDVDDLFGVVDCTPKDQGDSSPEDLVWRVSSPTDFTGAGIAIRECMDALADRGATAVHVLFETLSTLLVSVESEMVFRYAHHMTMRVGSRNGVGFFPVYTNVTTGTDLERLKHLFDAQVEVRRRGGRQEIRCSGFGETPTGWLPLADPADEPDLDARFG